MSNQPEYTCGTCHRTWDYPTPASRCPFEYEHEDAISTGASEEQIRDLAEVVARQVQAIASNKTRGPRYSAIRLARNNLETLAAWVGDDR